MTDLIHQYHTKVAKMLRNTSDITPSPGDIAMENLYPALVECFVVIICGYVAGRCNLISQTEAKGLNTFVGTFALPSLIFLSMAQLDLSSVNWTFLLSILIAKAIVFFGVGIITLLVSRPINLGRAGLFSIFLAALYAKTHPEYPSYLYLVAPVSLVILNPLGFVLMELGKHRDAPASPSGPATGSLHVVWTVLRSIALNPVVLMTALGMIGNLIFHHQLPIAIAGVLKLLGSAFSAPALFLLGLRMVGKLHKLQGAALLIPGILIAVKLLVLPLVNREVVSLLKPGFNDSETLDFSTYGFLYGTFPAAPGVFVFATQYNIDVDLIASAMVVCTFVSAPLMFVSARMVTLTKLNPSDYLPELDNFVFNVSIVGTIICVWLLVVFILSKKYRRLPHRFTLCLVISQLLSCIGAILWTVLGQQGPIWRSYVQFTVFALGVYGCRLWTAFIAIALLFMQCRSLCFVLKLQPYFILMGWGLPTLIVLALLLVVKKEVIVVGGRDPNFDSKLYILVVTVGCLVLHQRYKQRYARYLLLVQDVSGQGNIQEALITSEEEEDTVRSKPKPRPPDTCSLQGGVCNEEGISDCEGNSANGCCSRIVDIEDISVRRSPRTSRSSDLPFPSRNAQVLGAGDLCPGEFDCGSAGRESCRAAVERYRTSLELPPDDSETEGGAVVCCRAEEEGAEDEAQTLRHVVLLLLLLCSMFVGIALCIWTLVMEQMSGIYVELSFLDASLNFGQSLFVFACFGLDSQLIVLPFIKRWRKFWYGSEALQLPRLEDLDPETLHVCEQFRTHHLANCHKAIARNRRWRLRQLRQSFPGCELVDWLVTVGLANDRVDAVKYGRHLLDGRVLRHVGNQRHFHDSPFFYTFSSANNSSNSSNGLVQ
ncbi:hypothetical protein B566_EDAN004452 [Ephemera danica]|nr:hypothetical protein B566_EDAN004452 [Ephemera danica]